MKFPAHWKSDIVWTDSFPQRERSLGYLRLLMARYRYFDYYGLGRVGRYRLGLKKKPGYQSIIKSWCNKFKDRRCFVIGNGPSLKKMNLSYLKDEITIGANAIYKAFSEWGFHTTFVIFEDIEQTEIRRYDIPNIFGPIKLAALYNAYAFKADSNTVFMNARLADGYYWRKLAPMFSKDFAHIVYLGSTVTYLALQLAYYLGCNPVYLIGVDHNYGDLPKLFPPGKLTITEENIHLVRGVHFSDNYYQIGDQLGVPNVEFQEAGYAKAREVFEQSGRKVLNAGLDSKLEIFERCSFSDLTEVIKLTKHIKLCFERGEYEKTTRTYEQAVGIASNITMLDYLDLYYQVGEAYLRINQPDKARAVYEQAIHQAADKEDNANLRRKVGDIYYSYKKIDQAIEIYNQVLSTNPNNYQSRFGLARAYTAKGWLTEAKQEFEKVVEITNHDYYTTKAQQWLEKYETQPDVKNT